MEKTITTITFSDSFGRQTSVEVPVYNGISVRMLGTVPSVTILKGIKPDFGDTYMIDTGDAEGHLYQWVAKNYPHDFSTGEWLDLGKFRYTGGIRGNDGDSAYTVWVNNQTEGADTSVTAYLKFTEGKPGKPGTNGTNGTGLAKITITTEPYIGE